MSRLIETVRIEQGSVGNPEYHVSRIHASSIALFGKLPRWDAEKVLAAVSSGVGACSRGRLLYDNEVCQVTVEPYTIRPVASLKVVTGNHIEYGHKYADRSAINALVNKRGDCDDVLIIKNGRVTDVSYANIIFRRHDTWVTPDTYLLNGTMRQYLLRTGRIIETPVYVDDLTKYSHFKLINAMLRLDAPESEVSNIR